MKGYPKGCRVFQLRGSSKKGATPHAHHNAVELEEFFPVERNVGIALKYKGIFQFIAADLDRPDEALEDRFDAEGTWSQQCPHGRHWLFIPPPGWSGTNSKLPGGVGDLKCDGYIVGPNSSVECDGSRHGGEPCGKTDYVWGGVEEVKPAPQWVLDLFSKPAERTIGADTNGIPNGSHDDFLYSTAKFLRQEWGLSEDAIAKMLKKGPRSVLEGQNPTDPYSDKALDRIARSAAKKAQETQITLTPPGWDSMLETPYVGPVEEWWVYGFVPKGCLVLLYGKSGCGKSSFGSWLAGKVTGEGRPFVLMGVEEKLRVFGVRAVLGGADPRLLYGVSDAYAYKFPRDTERLVKGIKQLGAGAVYMDSIYSHFEAKEGLTSAERTRQTLGLLDEVAQDAKCTIIGIFHPNKEGSFSGSEEMRNVPRVFLKAERANGPLRVRVDTSNLGEPGKALQFTIEKMDWHDPETGEAQMERREDGTVGVKAINIPRRMEDISEADLLTQELAENFGGGVPPQEGAPQRNK